MRLSASFGEGARAVVAEGNQEIKTAPMQVKTLEGFQYRLILLSTLVLLGVVLFSGKAQAYNYSMGFAEGYGGSNPGNGCGVGAGVGFTASTTSSITAIKFFPYTSGGTFWDNGNIMYVRLWNADTNWIPTGSPIMSYSTTTNALKGHFIPLSTNIQLTVGNKYALTYEPYNFSGCNGGGSWYTSLIHPQNTNEKAIVTTNYGSSWSQSGYYPAGEPPVWVMDWKIYTGSPIDATAHNLSFTDPQQNQELLSPPTFNGTCDSTYTPLDLIITPNPCYWSQNSPDCSLTYTDTLIAPISCVGNVWTYSGIALEPNRYTAQIRDNTLASSSVSFFIVDDTGWSGNAGSESWFHNTTTMSCEPMTNWSCDMPLINDPCWAASQIVNNIACYAGNTYRLNLKTVTSTKPFSYAWQTYNAFHTNLTNSSTATSTLSFTLDDFGTNVTLFNASSTMNSIFKHDQWEQIRPYLKIPIYIGFIAYIIALVL